MEASPVGVVRAFFEHVSAGRIDDAFALVADDVTWWVPGTLPFSGNRTKPEYLQIVRRIQAGFPAGLRMQVHGTTCEGNRVAAEVESEGQHTSGKRYNNKYHFLVVVEGGRIRAVKEYMDTLHLAQLIG